MKKYNAEWLRQRAVAINAYWMDGNPCHKCGTRVGYTINLGVTAATDRLYFRTSCDCQHNIKRMSSFEDIAGWLGMLRSDAERDRIVAGMYGMNEGDPHARISQMEACLQLWLNYDSLPDEDPEQMLTYVRAIDMTRALVGEPDVRD